MHESIDPWRRTVDKSKLREVLKKHNDSFSTDIESVGDLREYDDALGLARLLAVPEYKKDIDHTRDLSLAAKKGYKANATRVADKQHAAARILADYHGFDWKKDIIEKDEERLGELGTK